MKKIRITLPDGHTMAYESITQAGKQLGVTKQTLINSLKTNKLGHTNIEVRYIEDETQILDKS